MKALSIQSLKEFSVARNIGINFIETDSSYEVFMNDGSKTFEYSVPKTTPENNEQVYFEDNCLADCNKSSTTSETFSAALRSKKDIVNSQIYYLGETKDTEASDSDLVWRIQRVITSGGESVTDWANNGEFTSAWSQRTTYFTSPNLLNTLSTSFDGINDFVNFGDVFLFDRTNQFSFSFWIKPDNIASQYCFYSKVAGDVNVSGISFQVTSLGRLFVQLRASGGTLAIWTGTILTIVPGQWQNVVITYNGGSNVNGIRGYVNAVVDSTPASTAISGTWLVGQSAMLGARNGGFYYVGKIDEVSVWNKELSSAEVTEIYNSGTPDDLASHSAYANLTNWYRMGDGDTFPTILDHRGSVNGTMQNMTSTDFEGDVP